MSSSMQEWVERLSAKPLPAMRQTLSRARDLLDASNTNHSVLGEVVARDPGFSLYLLRSLNSLPKGPREPVSNIPNAISLLGMAAIERAIHDLPTLDGGSTESAKLGLAECYSRAAHAGIYAAGLAKWRGQAGQQAFATAALLHDVGEMALWAHTPQVMNKIQRLIALGGGREDAAVQVLGFTLEELNRQLGSRWRLPALAQESQGIFNSYKPQPLTVMLACAVARASAFDWQNRELLDLLELLAELLELPLDQVQSQLHQYAAHAARELQPLEFPLPAFRLVLAPSKEIRTTTSEPDRQPQGKAGTNRPIAGVTPDRQTSSQSRPAQEDQTNPLHTQLMRAFRDMQQHHGLRSVMFAMLSPDKTRLKARFVAGEGRNHRLQDFDADLSKPSLFSALMKKPQALWLNPENREKYQSLIPSPILQALSASDFLIMSVFVRERPIGLFYADNGAGLTQEQYNRFKLSCQRFIQALT